jgi:predicted nucleic acid-binding protein
VTVFVDTSALYAVLDRDDSNHRRATQAWRDLLANESNLVTNNYVLLETLALLQNRLGIAAVRAFQEDVRPLLAVDWVTEEQHRMAVEAVLAAGRKKLSVVDCVSFQSMREQGIRSVFSFDQHFREQGFRLAPAD